MKEGSGNTPRLLDDVHQQNRLRHMPIYTEEAYLKSILRYHHFIRRLEEAWIYPSETGSGGVNALLTMLAVEPDVSASPRNQSLSALFLLFTKVRHANFELNAIRVNNPQRHSIALSTVVIPGFVAGNMLCHGHTMTGLKQIALSATVR